LGLIQEVQELKMEYKKAKQEAEKATKQAELIVKKQAQAKERKQNQKEFERDLKKAVEDDLREIFEKCFERDGLEKGYINLSLKATRDEIMKNAAKSALEVYYINTIYETTLNKVKKIYENDLEAKIKLEQIAKQKEAQKWNIIKVLFFSIYNGLKWIFAGLIMLIVIIIKDANKK